MFSTVLFVVATLLLSLNFVRPFGLAISDWLYFGALCLAFLETFLVEKYHAPCWWRNRFLSIALLILLGAVLSTINSRNWAVAIIEISQQIFVLTLFVSLLWILVRRGRINYVIFAFIFSGVFTAGVVLVDYFTGSRFGPALSGTPDIQLWGRFAGSLGHPNKLGYFLVLTTLLSIGWLQNRKTSSEKYLSRLIWCALIVVQVFGIYLSGSLTAYLGLVVGIIIFAITLKRFFVNMIKNFGMVAVVALLTIGLMLATHFVRIEGLFTQNNNVLSQTLTRVQSYTAESRLTTYSQAWEQIYRNPWLGVGYDQLSTSGISPESRLIIFSVHNPLIELWYTGGLFAFLGWIAMYVWVGFLAVEIIKSGKNERFSPLILGLASATLAALFMDQLQDSIYQREKWLVIGLLVSMAWEKSKTMGVKENPAAI